MVNVEHPKVFISYSWEDESHKTWVKNLADKLLADGIDATVDQYDLSWVIDYHSLWIRTTHWVS